MQVEIFTQTHFKVFPAIDLLREATCTQCLKSYIFCGTMQLVTHSHFCLFSFIIYIILKEVLFKSKFRSKKVVSKSLVLEIK